jgi:hypothetical protein
MSTTSSHAVFFDVRCCFVGWMTVMVCDLRGKRTTYDSDCCSLVEKLPIKPGSCSLLAYKSRLRMCYDFRST